MVEIRKLLTTKETVLSEMGQGLSKPITRVAGLAVVRNPLAGQFAADLSPLYQIGRDIGDRLAEELVGMLGGPAVSYGKGALVGLSGEVEQGGACVHPMLGKPMRAATGGAGAVIPSNVKVAAAGAQLDVPLGHKDNVWSFDHFDTLTVMLPDAPRLDEIVVVLAYADGGRPIPRCGDGPV